MKKKNRKGFSGAHPNKVQTAFFAIYSKYKCALHIVLTNEVLLSLILPI